jgi:hypothetical protein
MLFTRWMTLQEHGFPFTNFFGAALAALLVGRVVLVVDNLPFMRRFDGAPLIRPILFKTAICWVVVFVFPIAEAFAQFLLEGHAAADLPAFIAAQLSWPRFFAIQTWLMVLFLIYVTIHELNLLFGDGELARIFFRSQASRAELSRRQRIRLLTPLNPLAAANSGEAISERGAPAHAELLGILRRLAAGPATAKARA